MADLQKTVEIIFGGRNELSKVVGEVERSLDSLNSASAPFASMADDVLRAETAVVALGLAFAGLSINQAGTFGDQFAEISTLIDANVSELDGYRQSILDYAKDSTQSLGDINGAVYSAISAGVDYTNALGVLSDAERLAVAGKADLNSTLVALASTMNAYGAEVDQVADFSDIFFTTVKQGQTTIPELAASLSQVTSTAAAAGVPFDDLSAAIAALTASGMPTSQAITSIKAALSNIIKPSKDAQQVAQELGIEFNATALRTQGLGGFLQTLQTATGGNIETMGRLFGSVEGLNGVMALAADSSGIFAGSLEAMENRAGATAAAFDKMADEFANSNQRLVNNLQVVLIGVGAQLLDEYGDVVDNLIANLQGIGTAIDRGDLDGLIGIFEAALSDISGLLSGIADVLPQALAGIDWSHLESSFDNLKESVGDGFAAIFGGLDLGTVDGVQSAIQTLVDLLSGLTNASAGVIDGMRPLFVALGTLAENFAEADANGQQFAGQILGIGKSVNVITGFLSGATEALGGLSQGLLLLGGGSMIKALSGLATSLGGAASGATTLASSLAGPAGVAAVVGASALAVGGAVKTYLEWKDAEEQAAESADRAAASAARLAEKYREISENTGIQIESTQHFYQLVKEGQLVFDEATRSWQNGAEVQRDYAEEVRLATERSYDWNEVIKEITDENGNLRGAVVSATEALRIQNSEAIAASAAWYEMQGNSREVALRMAEMEVGIARLPLAKFSADTKEAAEETDKLKTKLEELASNETIRAMELTVDLQVASIEADTERINRAFDSIDSTIAGTGEQITGLMGLFADLGNSAGDVLKGRKISEQLDKENDRRDKAMQLQEEMIKAQIAVLELKREKMASGESLVTVKAEGLKPALEMIFHEVLEGVQVQINEEGGMMLIGLNV